MPRFSTMFTWLGLVLLAIIVCPVASMAGVPDTVTGAPLLFAGIVSMDQIFKTRVLVIAINKMRPFTTRALDLVFGRKKGQLSSMFAWDIKASNERVLKNLRVTDAAQVTNGVKRKTVTCEAPRFSEKRFIGADKLDAARKAGEQGVELMKEKVADEQFDMRGDVDRTREFMAVKCLSGQVVDESGTVIVDYNFPAAQKPVLAAGSKWSEGGTDPIVNIRAWKKYISQRVAVDKFVAICGSDAMDALIGNEAVGDKLKWAAGKQIAEEGRIAFLAGTQIDEYFGTYRDADGNIQEMVPANAFILVGIGADTAAELYAPVVDLDDEAGVGSGKEPNIFFSKAWDEKDPSGKWIKVESRPLPVLFQPECVIYATVC
ncbi:major capsid protein [Geobacter pelophilus]|uniref:Major capsid protein n=1 Tax=Geoanaerobacter pelophilus TaxID=60036 RepID=A0AAW4LEA8_9BACT|nr:major capsid protein [Geoanaerobacter pelophilus]MBT0666339.1 major capsid protein [Geoanaerobacter pelophilus]